MTARPPGSTGNRKHSSSRLLEVSRPTMFSSRFPGRCSNSSCSLPSRRRAMACSLTGRRPWDLSPISCPLNSPPSRASSGIKFRTPSRRSFCFVGCKSTNATARTTSSGSATAVLEALSCCLNAFASTRRRWSGLSPPSLPPAGSCSGCSSGHPCGAALALRQDPALRNSASVPALKPGGYRLLTEHV